MGGFIAQYRSWRWSQWAILFGFAFVYIPVLFIPETYKKAILTKRAKQRGSSLPEKVPKGLAALKFLLTVTLLRPIHMLMVEPVVAWVSLYVAFVFAVLFSFFEAFPIVFGGIYG